MNSALYEGQVTHTRREPFHHRFTFRFFWVYLDLAELNEVFRRRWLWSLERPNLATFRRADYLGDPGVPLDTAVRDLVEARTGRRPGGPIRLLTHLRYAGYCFNPVSFYYCFDPPGERLESVVAEITNTPWGERHSYVLSRCGEAGDGPVRRTFPKEFHVSPFMPLDQDYRWSFSPPGERLSVAMDNLERNGRVFGARMALRRREITGWSLARALIRFPLLTWRIIAAIYVQALRLRMKGAPFHEHPGRRESAADTTGATIP